MESTGSIDIEQDDTLSLVGISHKGKVTYNIVDNEGTFRDTGLSCIKRLRDNKNDFISEMYKAQNYLSIKYLFDKEIIYSTKEQLKNNSNLTTFESIVNIIDNDNKVRNLYILDIDEDVLIVKTEETGSDFIALDYKDLASIKLFIEKYSLYCDL